MTSMGTYLRQYWLGLIVIAALILLPLVSSEYIKVVAMQIFVWGVFAISYDLLIGFSGIVSFGHAMFFGTGAYMSALLMLKAGFSFWATLPFVVVSCGLVGLFVGLLTLRFANIYFTIVTLALGQFFFFLITNALTYQFTGGDDGLHGIPVILPGKNQMYYFAFVFLMMMLFIAKRIIASPVGRTLVAIRENEFRAKMIGFNVLSYKLIILVTSGAMAGLAGSFNAAVLRSVFPGFMGALTTVEVLLMTIIGGMGSLVGPVIGAALVTVCQLYLSSYFESWLLIFGGIFVIVVLFLPKGLINIVYSSRMKKRSTGLEMNKKPYGSFRG